MHDPVLLFAGISRTRHSGALGLAHQSPDGLDRASVEVLGADARRISRTYLLGLTALFCAASLTLAFHVLRWRG